MVSVDLRCVQLVSDTAGVFLSVFKSENIDIDLWPKGSIHPWFCMCHGNATELFLDIYS